MCGMTNTTGSGCADKDAALAHWKSITGFDSPEEVVDNVNQRFAEELPQGLAKSLWALELKDNKQLKDDHAAKDAEIKRLTDEVALLKRTDRESRDEWLKSWGFGLFAVLKHGPIGEVLTLLQDGWISRGKAAEAMAEIMLGNTPNLPERKSSAFDDLEIPCDVVNELRRSAFELSNDKDMALGKLDQALGKLSAALRREGVLREALKESNCYCSPNDDDLCHRCAALSACDGGRK